MSAVLADIGGTHIRFARAEAGAISDPQKWPVADFKNLQEALAHYAGEPGPEDSLYIATAAWPYPDNKWRFARSGRWVIDPVALAEAGWQVDWIGNDFGAGARGAVAAGPEHVYEVQAAKPQEIVQERDIVLGSGTGLGLAYVQRGQVQETYGGHMEIPYRTDEQHMVIKLIRRLHQKQQPVSAEDVISGPGLVLLYQAVCMIHGQKPQTGDPKALIENRDGFLCRHVLRLYHEFLGLFAHQAVIYGHAYNGLYMDGGVLQLLVAEKAFDRELFLTYFLGDPLPLIKTQMTAMKINIVTDPYITLRGLLEIADDHA